MSDNINNELYFVSPDICSATDSNGTIIMSINKSKLYSVIGIGSIIWEYLKSFPEGISFNSLVTTLQNHSGIQAESETVEVDAFNFLNELCNKEIIYLNKNSISVKSKIAREHWKQILTLFIRGIVFILCKLKLYFIAAYFMLISVDLTLKWGNFRSLHQLISQWPIPLQQSPNTKIIKQICSAVDRACVWYLKKALCLHRSAIATCMLRTFGIKSEMIIGCRKMPFSGHAWVEVNNEVVNDKQAVREIHNEMMRY